MYKTIIYFLLLTNLVNTQIHIIPFEQVIEVPYIIPYDVNSFNNVIQPTKEPESRISGEIKESVCATQVINFIQTYVVENIHRILGILNDITANVENLSCQNKFDPITNHQLNPKIDGPNLTSIISDLGNILTSTNINDLIKRTTLPIISPDIDESGVPSTLSPIDIGEAIKPKEVTHAQIIPEVFTTTSPVITTSKNLETDLSCDKITNTTQDVQISGKLFKDLFIVKEKSGLFARFGLSDQGLNWRYFNEILKNVIIELLSPTDLKNIETLISTLYPSSATDLNKIIKVKSDIFLGVQNRDSKNPSKLIVRNLRSYPELFKDEKICLDLSVNSELTRYSLTTDRMRVRCFGSPRGNSCGKCGLPKNHEVSDPVIIKEVFMWPSSKGASIPDDQWRRNQYVFRGTFYHIFVKLRDC
ncbi:unnamed protein product [Gordionus sp. m RMFG-2023]|uniref:uncharacterized protein LOC135928753 n=1 Tax=Gordionus sp. m RMFG-2023 TaxID=3053472 RepID=UPI0030E5179E